MSDPIPVPRVEKTLMNKKILTPNPTQPIDRVPAGQLSSALAELSEAPLKRLQTAQASHESAPCYAYSPNVQRYSFDGDEE